MVGYLHGKILSKQPETNQCLLITGGVGYELTLPARVFDTLTEGQEVSLWVHTHAREDILMLYGFGSEAEKQFFRLLLGVSGLGPKTALSLLSEHGAHRLPQLIIAKEADEIATASGVGKKLAQRLTLELASKLEKMTWVIQLEKVSEENRSVALSPKRQLRDDLSSALTNLGYVPQQIKVALDRLFDREENQDLGFEACLKGALKELSSRPLASGAQEISGHG